MEIVNHNAADLQTLILKRTLSTFAPKIPLYPLESITFYDCGLIQPKIIVI